MNISLEKISKRFQRHWIFKDIDFTFTSPGAYAILGPNGCGKSTLLRIIAGMQSPSKGKITFGTGSKDVALNEVFGYTAFCAPGMELVEELTLREFLAFHFSFKRPVNGLSADQIITLTGLKDSGDKPIGDYSSGMKQRVKLAQAIFADTPLLLLDEPCTNLDQQGVEQYSNWIQQYAKGRLVIVASNDPREYFFCEQTIEVSKYK